MSNPKTMIQGTDLTLPLINRFTLATAMRALGQADVPMDGLCIVPERQVLHIAVSQESTRHARRALESAGLQVTEERTVVLMEMPQDPEGWFDRFRRLANAELKIDLLYVATNNRLVIGIEKGPAILIDLLAETLEGRLIAVRDFRIRTAECSHERNL